MPNNANQQDRPQGGGGGVSKSYPSWNVQAPAKMLSWLREAL